MASPAIICDMATHEKTEAEIDYPTSWEYRIVTSSEDVVRTHVLELLGDVEHTLVLGRRSSGGRYVSLHLTLVVQDEAQRLSIFEQLATHEAVRFVV